MIRTFALKTLGCKVNQYESQAIRERLINSGLIEVEFAETADLFIVNTCTVTDQADKKSRFFIRQAVKKGTKTCVTGCIVKHDREKLAADIKGISYIIAKSFFPEQITSFSCHTRAFLKVQDGCDQSCSYCKVRLVRGRSRSIDINLIKKYAQDLADKGYKELVLCGICLGSYGNDLVPRRSIFDILESLQGIEGIKRLRLSSIEPNFVDKDLFRALKSFPKVCPHLHIPMQSASNAVLKRMNRRYTGAKFLSLIDKLRTEFPSIGISTDIIVGFPKESESDFKATLDAVEVIKPVKVHCFAYSRRNLTKIFKEKPVEPLIVSSRVERLRKYSLNASMAFRGQFIGEKLQVLFENSSDGYISGYTENYIKIRARYRPDAVSRIMTVKINRVYEQKTEGEII